jgi:hypothetical protein
MDETRILTDAETTRRRAEQAASAPGRAITTCAVPRCPRVAHHSEFCDEHRPQPGVRLGVAAHLTNEDYAAIRDEVDAKAAPLFLIAMDWLTTQQLATIGIELPRGNP